MFDLTGIAEQGKQLNESFRQIIVLLTEIRDDQKKLLREFRPEFDHNGGTHTWSKKSF